MILRMSYDIEKPKISSPNRTASVYPCGRHDILARAPYQDFTIEQMCDAPSLSETFKGEVSSSIYADWVNGKLF